MTPTAAVADKIKATGEPINAIANNVLGINDSRPDIEQNKQSRKKLLRADYFRNSFFHHFHSFSDIWT